jgi:hypothetical protein
VRASLTWDDSCTGLHWTGLDCARVPGAALPVAFRASAYSEATGTTSLVAVSPIQAGQRLICLPDQPRADLTERRYFLGLVPGNREGKQDDLRQHFR